jgi:hypothetical protein
MITLSDSASVNPTFVLTCNDSYQMCVSASIDTCHYVFKVTVDDGELSSSDMVTVNADYSNCAQNEQDAPIN